MARALYDLHIRLDTVIYEDYKKPLLCTHRRFQAIKPGVDASVKAVACSEYVLALDDRRELDTFSHFLRGCFEAVGRGIEVGPLHNGYAEI